MSKVIIVKGKGAVLEEWRLNQRRIAAIYEKGFKTLFATVQAKEGLLSLFRRNDKVGIKINTIAGRKLSSRPETAIPLANLLADCGLQKKNIIIWDRTNRELKEAGYHLNINHNNFRVFGTDTNAVGYESKLVNHLNIGSLFSSIQSRLVTASISLAILKDHGLAGLTAGMKNYFGAIHNPNKYHISNCNPYVAELFETKPIKSKHRLSILDALIVQYHRGPSFHPRWAAKYEALIFSLDAVAADFVGWQIIEKLRAQDGLPSLKEEQREPVYLKTAEKMGLGMANLNEIDIIEEEV